MVKMLPNGTRYQGGPSDAEMQRRYAAATAAMKAAGVDILIAQASDGMLCQYVRWFAKVRTAHHCIVLFDREGNLSLLGHGGDGNPAIDAAQFGLKLAHNIAVPVFNNHWVGGNAMSDKAAMIIQEGGFKTVGIVAKNLLSLGFYENLVKGAPGCRFVDATELIDQLIVIKSEEELQLHRQAITLHERVAAAMPSLIYAGRTEREIGMDLYRLSCIGGACDYLTNITLGSAPLGNATTALQYQNKIVEEGDTINLLFEVPSQSGYYADLRRLWAVGHAAPEVLEGAAIANEAQDYLASICRPGISSKEVFDLGNEWLKKHSLPLETRMHGHGQGYGLVERPYFDARDPMILRENMFISLHPLIRLKGTRMALADNYLVVKDGPAKRLTTLPRQVIIV